MIKKRMMNIKTLVIWQLIVARTCRLTNAEETTNDLDIDRWENDGGR